MPLLQRQKSILPGFGLSLGYSLFYLSLIVLIPLSAVALKSATLSWDRFFHVVSSPPVVSAYWVTFSTALAAALINLFFGLIVAWVLVRYRFPFKRILDAMIDLPFALPTAVAGIALTTLYAPGGWMGRLLAQIGFSCPWPAWRGFGHSWWPLEMAWYNQVAYTPLGIVIALTFIGLPFVVRTVQPVLEEMSGESEEAASSLGANRWQTFWRVVFPEVRPALLTGFTLAFARAIGEYGSVVFIAGNFPMRTEIAPLMIIKRLEEFEYAAATSIALVMLAISFALLLMINLLQRRLLQKGG